MERPYRYQDGTFLLPVWGAKLVDFEVGELKKMLTEINEMGKIALEAQKCQGREEKRAGGGLW